jgi:hypothetical protein
LGPRSDRDLVPVIDIVGDDAGCDQSKSHPCSIATIVYSPGTTLAMLKLPSRSRSSRAVGKLLNPAQTSALVLAPEPSMVGASRSPASPAPIARIRRGPGECRAVIARNRRSQNWGTSLVPRSAFRNQRRCHFVLSGENKPKATFFAGGEGVLHPSPIHYS